MPKIKIFDAHEEALFMNYAYLLTGGNLGNRSESLEKAAFGMEKVCGRILKKSALYETAAWGTINQPEYLNQAIYMSTEMTAPELLQNLLDIERQLGRYRQEKYGSRMIDIDILFFNTDILRSSNLIIPHPHIAIRRFVLVPMVEIDPDFVHPVLHKTMANLLNECPDPLNVKKFYAENKV